MTTSTPPRPQYRNIHVTQIVQYRLPPAGIVSILHRVSGALLFLLMPFIIWMFDKSVTSDITYTQFTAAFVGGLWIVPGLVVKLAALALIWGYLHHFVAGVRHLWMDCTHSVSKEFGRSSAIVTLILSTGLTLALGAKLFL
jgi:succinate dehydrogenase / fumarate reductase cytochrome b subunit